MKKIKKWFKGLKRWQQILLFSISMLLMYRLCALVSAVINDVYYPIKKKSFDKQNRI